MQKLWVSLKQKLKSSHVPSSYAPTAWSLFVRLSHWLVAIAVLIDFFNESGWWHRCIGYAALALVMARLLYGLFSAERAAHLWWPGIAQLKQHLLEIKHASSVTVVGHNPLGQLAAYCMWALVIALGFTGWLSRTDALWGEDWPVDLHAILAMLLQGMVLLHITAVVLMGRLQKRALIRRMIVNDKP